jgi:hypothetical protein
MSLVEKKVVRLDKMAAFVNANFNRDFNIPYAIEIEQHKDERFGVRYAINFCRPENEREPVRTVFRSKMLAEEFVGDKFDQIENSIAGMGPGIELLGRTAWYWVFSGESFSDRHVIIGNAKEAWDAWTLATALLDGSKNRDLFKSPDFICPGVTLNQHVLCEKFVDIDRQVWLKRRTVLSEGSRFIESRWTYVKQYDAAHGLHHEEKHTISELTDYLEKPAPFELIMKARKSPFNP